MKALRFLTGREQVFNQAAEELGELAGVVDRDCLEATSSDVRDVAVRQTSAPGDDSLRGLAEHDGPANPVRRVTERKAPELHDVHLAQRHYGSHDTAEHVTCQQ